MRFWQIFVVDLEGNLTGTSLMTFMLCTIELMLAGLCINIPMLRPFYLRWRQRSKLSQRSNTGDASGVMSGSGTGYTASARAKGKKDITWIELVRARRRFLPRPPRANPFSIYAHSGLFGEIKELR